MIGMPPASILRGAALVFVAASLTACTGGGSDEDGEPVEAEAVQQAREVIQSASLADSATLDAVDAQRFTDAGQVAATELLAGGVSGDAKWAATWIYASAPSDPDVLRPLLKDTNASIRVMAAAALISIGDVTGFDPMVAALIEEAILAGSRPPMPVWLFARTTLQRYTGEDPLPVPDDGATDFAALHDAWSEWLEANRSSLRFDVEVGRWSSS